MHHVSVASEVPLPRQATPEGADLGTPQVIDNVEGGWTGEILIQCRSKLDLYKLHHARHQKGIHIQWHVTSIDIHSNCVGIGGNLGGGVGGVDVWSIGAQITRRCMSPASSPPLPSPIYRTDCVGPRADARSRPSANRRSRQTQTAEDHGAGRSHRRERTHSRHGGPGMQTSSVSRISSSLQQATNWLNLPPSTSCL
eukprot:1580073-Pyramimonas_sp.AAC.1